MITYQLIAFGVGMVLGPWLVFVGYSLLGARERWLDRRSRRQDWETHVRADAVHRFTQGERARRHEPEESQR